MAGTPKGRTGSLINTFDTVRNGQEAFVTIYKAMEVLKAAGYVNRISLYYGDGGATGMNYWDEANPCGDNSFAVYQFPPYGTRTWSWYFLMQWSNGADFGTIGSGSPGLIRASAGTTGLNLGFQAASAITGGGADTSPWAGTVLNNGADSKATPVWASAGGSVWVYPRSNNTGGTHSVNKQNCIALSYEASTVTVLPFIINMVADRDNLAISRLLLSENSASCMVCGIYSPLSGLTATNPFYMMGTYNGSIFDPGSTVVGTTGGGGTAIEGGIFAPRDSTVRTFKNEVPYWGSYASIDYSVNFHYPSTRQTVTSQGLFASETGSYGKVGHQDFVYHTRFSPINNTPGGFIPILYRSSANSRYLVNTGSSSSSVLDYLNPNNTRDGVDF